MDKKEYKDHLWESVLKWIDDVQDGSVITNKWIKLAVKRYVEDINREDIYADDEKVNQVFTFFWYININCNDRYARFIPTPFQIFILINIFGLYKVKDNKRKYNYAYLFTGKKSGKTTFSAALQLYGLIADGVVDPQSILIANSRDQASLALDIATSIINHSPALSKRLEAQRYRIIFKDRSKGGYCKIKAANPRMLDGLGSSMCLLDEIHEQENADIFNNLKSGTISRENPVIFLTSTAGFSCNSLAYELFETGKRVLNKEAEDSEFFFMLFTLDEGDDWRDTSLWIKSNPNLNITFPLEKLISEYNQAKNLPSQLNSFLTKHLNIFTNEADQWIEEEVLKPCFEEEVDWKRFKGKTCYAGIDLSSTRDLTALSLSFNEGDFVYTRTIFFFANNARKRIRQNGVDLLPWIRSGDIIQCQTATIDYELLFNTISNLSKDYNIETLYYDKFNSALLIPKIEQELGINCIVFAQNTMSFNEPMKYLEKLIYDGKWKSSNNGALRWNFRNVIIYKDGNGNIKIIKNKSIDSVDGCVSTAMSIEGIFRSMNQLDLSDAY